MQLARVLGSATSTVKHPSLARWRLAVVQPLGADGVTADGEPVVAIDGMHPAAGQVAIISSDGKSTRELVGDVKSPARWCIVGIVDA